MTGTLAEIGTFACFFALQLGVLAILWIVWDLQAEVARLTKVAAAPADNLAPAEVYVPLHEFEELQKLVFSHNHIIRALHEEVEELRKRGGGRNATKKVLPKRDIPQRRKVSKNNVFQ